MAGGMPALTTTRAHGTANDLASLCRLLPARLYHGGCQLGMARLLVLPRRYRTFSASSLFVTSCL